MKYLITSLLLCCSLICNAQRHVLKFRTIIGTVTDKNNHPLNNCSVIFAGIGMGSETDKNGHFKLHFPDETVMLNVYNHADNDRRYLIKVTPDQQTLNIKLDKATDNATVKNLEEWKQSEAMYTDRISQAIQSEEFYKYVHNGQHRTDIDIDGPAIGDSPAQPQPVDTSQVYASAEKQLMFGNTNANWNTYVQTHLQYPEQAKKDGTQGKVIATFVVERDGRLTDIKILRAPSPDCGAEVERLLKSSPKWNPAQMQGKNVRCQYTISIPFKL